MKRILFFLFLLPCIAGAQNYIINITPEENGLFTVELCDDTDESEPLECQKWTGKDTAWVQLWGLQRMEQAAGRKNTLISQVFLAELNIRQTRQAIRQAIPFNYNQYAASQFTQSYDGEYRYWVRGQDNIRVQIADGDILRKSDGEKIARLRAETANGFYLLLADEEVLLTQTGNRWQGQNAEGQIVTLKRL